MCEVFTESKWTLRHFDLSQQEKKASDNSNDFSVLWEFENVSLFDWDQLSHFVGKG